MITALQHEQLAQIDLLFRRGLFDQIPATDRALLYAVMDNQPDTLHDFCRHCHQPITRWAAGQWRHGDDRSRHCLNAKTHAVPERQTAAA